MPITNEQEVTTTTPSSHVSNPGTASTLPGGGGGGSASKKMSGGSVEGFEVHDQIVAGRGKGRYWSITTMPSPFSPWAPLPAHGEMETRPCHCSKSRIHLLRCGHTVAVAREAQPCAQNCVGMDMEGVLAKHITSREHMSMREQTGMDLAPMSGGPSAEKPSPREFVQQMVDTVETGLKAWAQTFLLPSSTPDRGLQIAMTFKRVYDRMCFVHQKPRPDFLNGDFECQECGTQGHRASVPAFTYTRDPYHIIIPVRDEKDATLVRALERGVRPCRRPQAPGRGHGPGRDHSRGRGRGRDRPQRDRVLVGRVTRHRMAEKEKVIGRLKEEMFAEAIEGLSL